MLETDSSVHQVTQNQARCFWLTIEKQRCSLIKQRLRKRRVALNASNDGIVEISGQCHLIPLVFAPKFACHCLLARFVLNQQCPGFVDVPLLAAFGAGTE